MRRYLLLWLVLPAGAMFFFNTYVFPSFMQQIEAVAGQQYRLPDVHLMYSTGELRQLLQNLGSEGRSIYRQMILQADLLYPLCYSLFFYLLLQLLSPREKTKYRYWKFLPFAAAFFDYLENLSILFLLHAYPAFPAFAGRLAAFGTTAKWATLFMVVIGAGMASLARLKKHLSAGKA
jgi:hypothetical protein